MLVTLEGIVMLVSAAQQQKAPSMLTTVLGIVTLVIVTFGYHGTAAKVL